VCKGEVRPLLVFRETCKEGDTEKTVRFESSSVEENRLALFQRASSATLMSVLTSASISVDLVKEDGVK
jgi:hypothetical protein